MFVRAKKSGDRVYLQLVESYREGKKVKQRVLMTLGRLDQLQASGAIESVARSTARFTDKLLVLEAHARGEATMVRSRRIGPALIFGRLWEETGCAEVIRELAASRNFGFDLEAAVFLTVLNRLFDPGSDRAAERWREDYMVPASAETLQLHQLYRAMAWLGEELPEEDQDGRTPFAPRCTKDLIEERIFERRRDEQSLALVLMDTTSIYFHGNGGETLGQHGYSRDHRPELKQMVLAIVIDQLGRPVCTEMWPGNTVDVNSLVPVADRLQRRFNLREVFIIADRGMVSAKTIATAEARGWSYILGCRMRKQKEVTHEVLSRAGRYAEVTPERTSAKDPEPLKVKEVQVDDRRYVVCLNEERKAKDKAARKAILSSLKTKLQQGSKSLVGNTGYRRFLRRSGQRFEIDREAVKNDARLDGKWVLRTNSELPAAEVALQYKLLWMVEDLFRTFKSVMETRPVYHRKDTSIRGHVFCSFLALVLRKELQDRLEQAGHKLEWADIIKDLDSLTEMEIDHQGSRCRIRSQTIGTCGTVFQTMRVALPPTFQQVGT